MALDKTDLIYIGPGVQYTRGSNTYLESSGVITAYKSGVTSSAGLASAVLQATTEFPATFPNDTTIPQRSVSGKILGNGKALVWCRYSRPSITARRIRVSARDVLVRKYDEDPANPTHPKPIWSTARGRSSYGVHLIRRTVWTLSVYRTYGVNPLTAGFFTFTDKLNTGVYIINGMYSFQPGTLLFKAPEMIEYQTGIGSASYLTYSLAWTWLWCQYGWNESQHLEVDPSNASGAPLIVTDIDYESAVFPNIP